MSTTFTLCGEDSILEANFYPPIKLKANAKYALGLISFNTFHSIPNIDKNYFYYDSEKIEIPTGSYEINDLENLLKSKLGAGNIELKANNSTLQCELTSSFDINFEPNDSLHDLLGFEQKLYLKNTKHVSNKKVNIIKVPSIRIDCNITTGAYFNNDSVHTIHEFAPKVPPGFIINEVPKNVIYLPITAVDTIHNITLKVLDQEGNKVNFRKETIQIRLELKEWQ